MNKFEVVSEFQPKGDQPNAIKELKKGLDKNIPHQTLKGIRSKTSSSSEVASILSNSLIS